MNFDAQLLWLFPVIFVASVIDAIAGGGGLITIPTFLLTGLPPTVALGTNKFVMTTGTIVSAVRYVLHGRVLWRIAAAGIPCSLLGSALGAHAVSQLSPSYVRGTILILLPIAAAFTLLPRPKHHVSLPLHWRSLRLWLTIPFIGLGIGWYDGFFGPGTGSLLILALYGISRISLLHSVAVGRLFNLASNIAALAVFMWHDQVRYALALPLAIACIAGNYVGSHFALRRGDRLIRITLAFAVTMLMLFLGWQLFY